MYFQGFDIHTRVSSLTGLNAGGDDDASPEWSGGSVSRPSYAEGYLEGQAIVPTGNVGSFGPRILSDTEAHVGFWARLDYSPSTYPYSVLFGLSCGQNRVELRWYNDYRIHPVINGVEQAVIGSLANEWRYFQVDVNWVSGTVQVNFNGALSNYSFTPVARSKACTPHLNGAGDNIWRAHNPRIDHYWQSEQPLPQREVIAVSVVTSQDRYEGINGTRGALILNGSRYSSSASRAIWTSLNSFGGQTGRNTCNTVQHLFEKYPIDNTDWTPSKLAALEGWGVCFWLAAPSTRGDRIRIDAMLLQVLKYSNGRPIVEFIEPKGLTFFSGPWEKSNPDKTFVAHVNKIPRPDVGLAADAESLYIGDEGCIFFPYTDETGDPEARPFEEVGLTFAEEYREDYLDWAKVTGGEQYDSYVISGYGIYGEGDKQFQDNYITVNYENVSSGGAYIQGLWDYTVDPNTGRWSMKQQVYSPRDGYKHLMRKLKIRGAGRALQVKITNDGNKPFLINGWSKFISGNTQT